MTIYSFFAIAATILSLVSYIPYLRDIRLGKTKPHIFSWVVWTLMTGIFFFAQLSDGAGIGALTSGVTTCLCLYIIFASLKQSDKSIKSIDYFSLAISIVALLIWYFVKTPLYSVILITIADIAAFLPTIRKSYMKPYSETLSTFVMAGIKHTLNVFSLERITLISSFYTFYLIGANVFFVSLLILRRKALKDE
jgi:hypothetical protein